MSFCHFGMSFCHFGMQDISQLLLSDRYLVDGPLSPKHFHFGPIMFRLLHTLDDPDTSLSLFADEVSSLAASFLYSGQFTSVYV